jgi:uncharacterized protein involved in tolerance to divalent cations
MLKFVSFIPMINISIYLDDEENAKKLVLGLLRARLVAHAAIEPENETLLNLEGEIIHKTEYLITAQSKALLFNEVCEHVKNNSSAQIKILSVPITQCNETFSEIIRTETKNPDPVS